MEYASAAFAAAVRRLRDHLEQCKAEGRQILLLGAGEHTAKVMERLDLTAYAACLYDDCPSDAGPLPVRPLDALPLDGEGGEGGDASFVLCSHFQQENLATRLMEQGVPAERLFKMYSPADRVLQFAPIAYDPAKELAIPSEPADPPEPGLAGSRYPGRRVNRVLLVHPPFARANRRHKKTMPMGLLALGASLRHRFPDLQVELVDAHISNLDPQTVIDWIRARRFDLVCLTAWTAQAPMAYAIADAVRAEGLAWVVLGGVHPSLCPDEAIRHADCLVAGEGELPLTGLVEALNAGTDPGAVAGVVSAPGQEPGRQFVENLDDLPFPAWELLPNWRLYDFPLHVVGGFRFPIMGSRGCPFNCTFCSSPLMWRRRVRWNSAGYVAEQMLAVHRRYGVAQFHFWDDNLLIKPGHIETLCNLLLDSGVSFKWLGLSRASDINRRKELLPLMRRAGCVGMEIGIESFTQESADLTQKGEKVEAMAQAAANLSAAGLAPLYTHMLFTPGEDLASYPAKQHFLSKINEAVPDGLRSDGGLGQLTTPHRTTVFADEAPGLGLVLARENAHFVHHRVNFIPNSLLADIPHKRTALPGSPYPFLYTVVGYVHDWTLADMEHYVRVTEFLWPAIDGARSVRDLADLAAREFPFVSLERATTFTALALVGWAKDERIAGVRHDAVHDVP